MINGFDIYYSKNIGQGLKPVSTKQKANGLKPVSNKGRGLKPVSKGKGCNKVKGDGLKILQYV